jgi:hypothetical protein
MPEHVLINDCILAILLSFIFITSFIVQQLLSSGSIVRGSVLIMLLCAAPCKAKLYFKRGLCSLCYHYRYLIMVVFDTILFSTIRSAS